MAHLVLTYNAEGSAAVSAARISDDGNWLADISMDAIAHEIQGAASVTGILPGTSVSSQLLDVPELSAAKLQKVLPGLMADYVSTNAQALHFAIGGKPVDGQAVVYAVDQKVMESLLTCNGALGVHLTKLLPDYSLLDADQSLAVCEGPDTLVRLKRNDGSGFTLEKETAMQLDSNIADDCKTLDGASWNTLLGRAPFVNETLLTGAYAQRADIWGILVYMRRLAIFTAVASLVWLGASVYDAVSHQQQARELEEEAVELFRQAFPDVKRVVNMEAQARSGLRELEGQGGSLFLQQSSALFSVIEKQSGVYVETIRFDSNRQEFSATISFGSYRESEQFRREMQAADLTFTEGSSRQDQARILTDIVLTQRGAQ